MEEEGEAMEYEVDQDAQDMQGRLCTDQVQENLHDAQDDEMMEDYSQPLDNEADSQPEVAQRAEKTGA